MGNNARRKTKNIGFISTRLAGTDGVSLEAAKWASIFESEGHLCFYMAGEFDKDKPNVMDFDNPPSVDDYSSDIRTSLGLKDDELLILQPTRVVKRKRIENSIELVSRLNRVGIKAKLVISYASGDEGYEYEKRVREYSSLMRVDTLFISDIIKPYRGKTPDGRKIYTPQDIYPHADLITYPSSIEGFGNAFLEAIYFRKVIVVNDYSVYVTDIKPKGFKTIELPDYVDSRSVELTKKVLEDPVLTKEIVEHNYELGKRHYSYSVLRRKLKVLVSNCFGVL